MSILEEFKQAINDAITDYETSRPFGRAIRDVRAKDIMDIKTIMNEAESVCILKGDIEDKISKLETNSLSFMDWLDKNALVVRVTTVLKNSKFSEKNLAKRENSELQRALKELALKFREMEAQLIKVQGQTPQAVEEYKKRVAELEKSLAEKVGQYTMIEEKNTKLITAVNILEKERDDYKEQKDKLNEENQTLSKNNIALLSAKRELEEKNRQLADKVMELEKLKAAPAANAATKTESKGFFNSLFK